jgi:hypothetical protein
VVETIKRVRVLRSIAGIDVTLICNYTDFNETGPVTFQTPPYRAAFAPGLNPVRRSGGNFNYTIELGGRTRKCFNEAFRLAHLWLRRTSVKDCE